MGVSGTAGGKTDRAPVWEDEEGVEVDGGTVWTTMWMYLMPQNHLNFFKKEIRALGLSAIFWETSAPWERSGGRSECAGWSAKEERWGRGPSKLVYPWKPQKQKQGKPEARDAGTKCGLHAYYLELINGSGTSVAILIALTTFSRPTLLISKPSLLVHCPGPVITMD